jgi:DNA-binding NarL/FixJ family response regulator
MLDVTSILDKLSVPTLVIHSREDDVVPVGLGHELAAGIKGAEFVELDSCNHVLLETEPAWKRFCEEVLRFTGNRAESHVEDDAFVDLTQRERQVLGLLAEGLANAEIAEQLSISEKTVRNHVSNLFDKLGVWSRAQAIVFARDRGFNA